MSKGKEEEKRLKARPERESTFLTGGIDFGTKPIAGQKMPEWTEETARPSEV